MSLDHIVVSPMCSSLHLLKAGNLEEVEEPLLLHLQPALLKSTSSTIHRCNTCHAAGSDKEIVC